MRQRDKAILEDVERFRALDRNQIIAIHFQGLKNKVSSANAVLKRLRRDGLLEADTDRQPFVYFPSGSKIKKNGRKVDHYLAIADFYIDVRRSGALTTFQVEPKFGPKGTVEPDVFMIWRTSPFFVEIQRSVYSEKLIDDKLRRYETYYRSQEWKRLPWQRKGREVFPIVWVVGRPFQRQNVPFRMYQSKNVADFLENIRVVVV